VCVCVRVCVCVCVCVLALFLSCSLRTPSLTACAQGPYYCSAGTENSFGRDIMEAHLQACLVRVCVCVCVCVCV
jgi:hypothetical protein